MFLRRITDFILQGRLHAMTVAFLCVYASLLTGGMFAFFLVGILGIVIAAFVTLRKGPLDGFLVTVAATFPYLLTYSSQTGLNGFWLFGLIVVAIGNLLTFLFAVLLRQYKDWSFALDLALVIGVLVVATVHLCFPDIQNWWATRMISYVNKTADALAAIQTQTEMTPQEYLNALTKMVDGVKSYVTGFIAASVLLSAFLPLLIARWWQAVMFNPGGLRRELYQIRLSYAAGLIFVCCAVLAYLGYATAFDMMPLLFGIYGVAGLSLVHVFLGPTKLWWLWLGLIYLGLMFFPFMLVSIAFFALLDTGLDFRKRFHKF